jgi:hypothetical protein
LSPDGTSGNAERVNSSICISAGELAYIVTTYRPSTKMRINVNGTATEKTTSVPAAIHSGTAPLWVGHHFSTASANLSWDGKILLAGVAARAWTEREEIDFIQDPFRMIRPNIELYQGAVRFGDLGVTPTTVPPLYDYYRMMRGGA